MNKILIGLFLTAFTFVANAATIENKTSQFDEILTDISDASADTAKNALAEQVRAQRAALDAASDSDAMSKRSTTTSGGNSCDKNLRTCMQEKCGKDYSKCAGDTDTLWGTKMESCRRNVTCTGEEYKLFTTEIKADRDLNAKLASYNAIIDCGNKYNDCIITECGPKFNKCLGKAAGDTAISKCEKIAKSCTEQDSGLASRTMNVFGTLRGNAEKQVQRDQERLYELREKMSSVCSRLGAMLDERSFDCVYSVNFYADSGSTLYASKKAYAGSTFSCNQNWFGIDITTFKENAYRLTQEQTSASSAMMGAGLGVGAGALTSGALDRAMDRAKADRALNSELCESTGGKWNKTTNLCNCGKDSKYDDEAGCVDKDDEDEETDEELPFELPDGVTLDDLKDMDDSELDALAEKYKISGPIKNKIKNRIKKEQNKKEKKEKNKKEKTNLLEKAIGVKKGSVNKTK